MPKSSDQRFTYRFTCNGRAQEVHSDAEEELLRRAVSHLDSSRAVPVHIRQGRRVLLDLVDILDAWENTCL